MINSSFGDIWDADQRACAAGDTIDDAVDKGTCESDEFTAYNTKISVSGNNFKFVFCFLQI